MPPWPLGKYPGDAYLIGFRAGLLLAAALVIAGGVTAYVALRSAHRAPEAETAADDLVLAG